MPAELHAHAGLHPIASYQPLVELGRGGMGVVYLARATAAGGFERLVVVKRLHDHLLSHPDAVRRFLDEARHAAVIHHANVVGIHQVGSDQDGYFLVLDYIEGTSIEGLCDRARLRGVRIPAPIALRIGLDALAGLQAVHDAMDSHGRRIGILHRDVSTQNVLVGRDGVARLTDFGIAKSELASVSTDKSYLVGKLLYMAPEHLRRAPVGPSYDVYALGMTLWIALTGEDPWPEANEAQLLRHILDDRVPLLSSTGLCIAPQIEDIIARACHSDPTRRFQSAIDMAEAIDAVGRDTGWIASHAEVARFVGQHLDDDLAQRRQQLAQRLDTNERALLLGPARAVNELSVSDTVAVVATPPPRRTGRPWLLGVAIAAAMVVATALLWLGRGKALVEEQPASSATGSMPAATEAQPAAKPEPTPPESEPTVDVSKLPTKSEPKSTGPKRAPPPPSPTASTPPTPTPAVVPPPPTPTPVQPAPPDGISKDNPYR